MNYQNIYNNLISRAKTRNQLDTYVERHHIIPKCMGGSNDLDNLVDLTPEEHYVAHMLLVKIYPSNSKLVYAAHIMGSTRTNNKLYGWIKRKLSDAMVGVPRSRESVEKQRATLIEQWKTNPKTYLKMDWTPDQRKIVSDRFKGTTIPVESRSSLDGYIIRYGDIDGPIRYQEDSKTKDSRSLESFIKKFGDIEGPTKYQENCVRLSESALRGEDHGMFGKTHTAENKALIAANTSKHQKGRLKSEEHKARIGAAHKGRKHTIVECPHCPKSGGLPSMKKWHFDNCKFKSV